MSTPAAAPPACFAGLPAPGPATLRETNIEQAIALAHYTLFLTAWQNCIFAPNQRVVWICSNAAMTGAALRALMQRGVLTPTCFLGPPQPDQR